MGFRVCREVTGLWGKAGSATTDYTNQLALLDFAAAHKKPVIIAESSPINYGVEKYPWECAEPELPDDEYCEGEGEGYGEGEASTDAWNFWFKPYFRHIMEHPNVKAISYINNDWAEEGFVDWAKDCQLKPGSSLTENFRTEVVKPIFRKRADVID